MEDRTTHDQSLVRSSLHGDSAAFGQLVAAYQKRVTGVAWRYGVDRDEIEDVVSEVFIKVYRNLGRYRPDYPFGTWLYRLAVNHVVDHGRRRKRERGKTELPRDLTDPGPGPARNAEADERATLVREAMRELKPRQREALFLVYLEGMKLEEAARSLGLPLGTVKTRLMRGRQALRKALSRRHPEYFGEPE